MYTWPMLPFGSWVIFVINEPSAARKTLTPPWTASSSSAPCPRIAAATNVAVGSTDTPYGLTRFGSLFPNFQKDTVSAPLDSLKGGKQSKGVLVAGVLERLRCGLTTS